MDFLCSSARTRHKVTRRGNNTQINCWNKSLHTGCPLLPCHASRHPSQFSSAPPLNLPLPLPLSRHCGQVWPAWGGLLTEHFFALVSNGRSVRGVEGGGKGEARGGGMRQARWWVTGVVNGQWSTYEHLRRNTFERAWSSEPLPHLPPSLLRSPPCLANGISGTWLCHLSALGGLVYLHLSIWICLVVVFFLSLRARSSQRNEKERKENSKAKVKVKDNVGPAPNKRRRQRQARSVWGKIVERKRQRVGGDGGGSGLGCASAGHPMVSRRACAQVL